jgi:hypothetical protein
MTPLLAVGSVFFCLVVYAWIGFWRFRDIDVRSLADHRLISEVPSVGGSSAVLGLVAVWGATIFALGHFGYDNLQGAVWAGTGIALLLFWTAKSFLPSRCLDCGQAVRRFRKRQEPVVPAIVHLKVCDHCKTYREELVIGVASS